MNLQMNKSLNHYVPAYANIHFNFQLIRGQPLATARDVRKRCAGTTEAAITRRQLADLSRWTHKLRLVTDRSSEREQKPHQSLQKDTEG